MRKIICINQENKECEKYSIKDFFGDPEDKKRRAENPLNAFKKTYAYNQLPEECKDNLDKYLGYEYESELDAKMALQNLMYFFEDSNNEKVEIKVVRSKNGNECKVIVSEKKHSHSEEVRFKVSDNSSVRQFKIASCGCVIMSMIFFGATLFHFVQELKAKAEVAVTASNFVVVFYIALFMAVIAAIFLLLYSVLQHAAAQKKMLYSFETNVCFISLLVLYISLYLLVQGIYKFLVLFIIAFVIILIAIASIQNGNVSFDNAIKKMSVIVGTIILPYILDIFGVAKMFSDIIKVIFN